MRLSRAVGLATMGLWVTALGAQAPSFIDAYRDPVARVIAAATADQFAWNRLALLTDTFGHRLSGSQALEDAIAWAVATMKADGFDQVWTDPVKVPKWVRGAESLDLVAPRAHRIPMLGLGMSVGTPRDGIEADLLVVSSFAELERRSAEARGRVVLFNAPYRGYGQTVAYRTNGASQAAQHGAVAMLVRSVGPDGLRTSHTGMLTYRAGVAQIPAAAIPADDAQRLARLAAGGQRLRVRERPDEIVVVSCHLDSWDVGTGASDDGGGCIAAWEAARLLKQLDLRPRRTVRVVLYTNEENGLRGGLDYSTRYQASLDRHGPGCGAAVGLWLQWQRHRARAGDGNRVVARIDRRHACRPIRRRRRHRAQRRRSPRSGDVAGGRLVEVFPRPSHGGRHGRSDRPH